MDFIAYIGGLAKVLTTCLGFMVTFLTSQNYTQQIAHAMYTWVKPKSFMAEGEKQAHMVATPLPDVGDTTCRRIY